jgi:hypothetical protein
MVFQLIQEFFLRSPFSPQKNLFKRESIEEIVPEEAMKKERA